MKVFDLKARRKELGLTLEEVGNFVGVGKSTVRKWETGYIENMKRDKIALLAQVLKVSPVEIVTGEPYTKQAEIPQELKDIGVEWMLVAKKAKQSGLTPEQITDLIQAVKR